MKKLTSGILAGILTLALAACGDSGTSSDGSGEADGYPGDDITMIVTYAAGGATDIAGRAIAQAFEDSLGVSVVVENVEGASGAIGSAEVAQARPDGLTIAMTTSSAVNRVPLIEEVGFTVDDVIPIGIVTQYDGVLSVPADSPYETIDDLIEAAEDAPNEITVGQAGAQVPGAVEFERMKAEYDVPFQVVPFQGDAPTLTGLLGENVDAAVTSWNESVQAQHEAGAIRPLAVMGVERTSYLPDVPTLAESGFDDLVYGTSTYIIIVPKGTPEAIVTKLETELEAAVNDADTRTALGGDIGVPEEFVGSEELSKQMATEAEALGSILQELFG
ncbi:MAG: tripartite tricarboxylate transporter substrate binding protein [Aeromicrobium sp.]|uniref:Bug family tripartite tricarboxylate transporter substrate binding protein n=1 Tax=Aeromicrobium sp. TaxID=1871063 RepID=UPI0026298C6E|nr:tripartite tricarboxylate transporter substrate binding protein [Aeromicrobium sp.]MDF1703562.1 tripartite tricarboxylate transporter substrate binding protein [Aeromicrobium sp.]